MGDLNPKKPDLNPNEPDLNPLLNEPDLNSLFDQLDLVNKIKIQKKCCDIQSNLIINGSELLCKCCNNVLSDIVNGPEWRYYGNDDSKSSDPTRCGMPVNILLPKSSIGSTVSNKMTGNKDIHKVKRYQNWNGMTYKERSRYKVYNEIKDICNKYELPKIIINEAKSLYTIMSETKISRGNNRKGIIASCVYFACKNCEVPRSSKEIAEMFSLETTVVTKGCKKFQEILQLNKINKNRIKKSNTVIPEDFIERFCNQLNIKEEDIVHIINICKKATKNKLISENTPPSIASGCIYLYIKLNNLDINKKDISKICKISEVTINKCCKKLEDNIDALITLKT